MRSAIQHKINDLNREIHDRTKAEIQLAKSENNLRVTLDSIGDAVIATDTHGFITRINPVAQEQTGFAQVQAVGQSHADVFQGISGEPTECPVKKVLSTGEIIDLANHSVLIARDGTERQIADSFAPIKDDHG